MAPHGFLRDAQKSFVEGDPALPRGAKMHMFMYPFLGYWHDVQIWLQMIGNALWLQPSASEPNRACQEPARNGAALKAASTPLAADPPRITTHARPMYPEMGAVLCTRFWVPPIISSYAVPKKSTTSCTRNGDTTQRFEGPLFETACMHSAI